MGVTPVAIATARLIAIDAKTGLPCDGFGDAGEVVWSFQTVHHDVWDYDLPAQPGLYSIWKNGKSHDVVAQVTKTGLGFVLDRDTGEPFLPVEERPVPQTVVTGEVLSPTQPFPVLTPPVVPSGLSGDDAFGITWFDRRICKKLIEESLAQGLFTPPSEQGTLIYPFNGGGANWGGAAFDPARNLLVINMSNMAHHVELFNSENFKAMRKVFHHQEVSSQTGAPYGVKRSVLSRIWHRALI
jgi:quinoprotein glucose dehydrogenase